MSYTLAKLVLINYQPKELEEDMMFAMDVHLRTWEGEATYLHVHTLDKIPKDQDKYIRENGFPVYMYLIAQEQTNPDMPERVLAAHDQIAWFDDGVNAETLRSIELSDINEILMNDGYVMVDADEDGDPILEMGYVTLSIGPYDDEDEDDEQWIEEWGTLDNDLLEPWDEQPDQQ